MVDGIGDLNGDGYSDVAVGVAQADPLGRRNAGSVFVIFGREEREPILLDPVPGPGVIRIDGAARGDRAGTSVASARDVDGDEIPDLVLGAPRADDGSGARKGAAYVLFGRALDKHLDLALMTSEGYRIDRPAFGRDVGKSVSTAGDMNADGLDDVIVGVPSTLVVAPPAAYVVYGQATNEPISLGDLDGSGWLIRAGDKENEEGAGEAVAGGQDVNADGIPDVVVGAPTAAAPFARNGVVFVIFGKSDASTVTLDALGERGFRIEPGDRAEQVGSSVELIPDQDGNGSADILLGVGKERWGRQRATYPGTTYHLVGQTSVDTIHLWRLGDAGVRYVGEDWEESGFSVAASPNFYGDGDLQLVAGAPRRDNPDAKSGGRVYVFEPVAAPDRDNPPRVEIRSYDTFQKAERGSYCWDGVCVDRVPTFPEATLAGTGNRAHYRVMIPERPDSFSLTLFRELDEHGRPTGEGKAVSAQLSPVKMYQGAPVSSYEAVFRLPNRPGDVFLVGTGSWDGQDRGDASWFSHLELTKRRHRTNMSGPPDMTLVSRGLRKTGTLTYGYCWSQENSDGTGQSMCVDLLRRGGPEAEPAQAGARAFVRIHTRHRPRDVELRLQRAVSPDGYPTGPARRPRYRLRPAFRHGTVVVWDVRFQLPRQEGHLYPSLSAEWDAGGITYDWHLRLR